MKLNLSEDATTTYKVGSINSAYNPDEQIMIRINSPFKLTPLDQDSMADGLFGR